MSSHLYTTGSATVRNICEVDICCVVKLKSFLWSLSRQIRDDVAPTSTRETLRTEPIAVNDLLLERVQLSDGTTSVLFALFTVSEYIGHDATEC